MQYTPRNEYGEYTVSYFLASAIADGDTEIIHSVIDGTLEELVLYEHSKNLNKFLRDELDPLYSSENVKNLLPSKEKVKEMLDCYINEKDRGMDSIFIALGWNGKDTLEGMRQLVSDWAEGK